GIRHRDVDALLRIVELADHDGAVVVDERVVGHDDILGRVVAADAGSVVSVTFEQLKSAPAGPAASLNVVLTDHMALTDHQHAAGEEAFPLLEAGEDEVALDGVEAA